MFGEAECWTVIPQLVVINSKCPLTTSLKLEDITAGIGLPVLFAGAWSSVDLVRGCSSPSAVRTVGGEVGLGLSENPDYRRENSLLQVALESA